MTPGEVPANEFISYIDDSGSMDKGKKFQLMTAVLIADAHFGYTETLSAGTLAAHNPIDKQSEFFQKFHEFKGWELFNAKGTFEGIDIAVCRRIMDFLLQLVRNLRLPVI